MLLRDLRGELVTEDIIRWIRAPRAPWRPATKAAASARGGIRESGFRGRGGVD